MFLKIALQNKPQKLFVIFDKFVDTYGFVFISVLMAYVATQYKLLSISLIYISL